MIADKESVVCGERAAQISKRCLEVWRPEATLDEGLFARQSEKDLVRRRATRCGNVIAATNGHCAEHQCARGSGQPSTSCNHVDPRAGNRKVSESWTLLN
jgi:hypothetical protein